ncbi:MAG TPA: DUF4445 domain-containing protein, partial [Acidimicrobiales bacterium]|nr:DUF4445 domain-containing protein [Acidimicrobiales bacterium]
EAGRRAGLILAANCGGSGICGRCRVTVMSSHRPVPTDTEARVLAADALNAGQRLACRSRLDTDAEVHVPRTTAGDRQRLQLEGAPPTGPLTAPGLDPLVVGHPVEVSAPSAGDRLRGFERVAAVLGSETGTDSRWRISPRVAAELRRYTGDGRWRFTAFTRGDRVVGVAPAGSSPLGVAVDLGCTKIAAYLLDLETGEQLAARGVPNPQISYGEDLVSRLAHAARGPSQARELALVVRRAVDSLVAGLGGQAGGGTDRVVDLCVVGNTAMTQLFLGRSVEGLLAAPFSADTSAADVPAADLGIELPGDVMVHVPPAVGAFVGADHVAVILANGLASCRHTALGIDIGTNTEVVLSRPGHGLLLTSSTPAGPIFEGGHISCGMRAAPGAVERVTSGPGGPEVRTIGGSAPVGLCGSGVVDAVALMWREGIIDRRGHIRPGAPGVRRGPQGLEFVVVPAAATGHGDDIVVTQADVSEVQLAKAAMAAGVRTLLNESGTPDEEVAEVVLAGAFGTYIDIDNAVAIGMLPHLPNAEYVQAGNSAGTGAKMALVSGRARDHAAAIARRAVNIGLTRLPGFNRELALATQFRAVPSRAGQSVGGQSRAGQSVGGQSGTGQSVGGQSGTGESVGGSGGIGSDDEGAERAC